DGPSAQGRRFQEQPRLEELPVAVLGTCVLGRTVHLNEPDGGSRVQVAGMQMEFPDEGQVLTALNGLAASQTNTDLFVLSEYTFIEPVPAKVKTWCRDAKKYLVV